MKIQINAATRLHAAKAGVAKTNAFLKSLGIKVTNVRSSRDGSIAVEVEDGKGALDRIEKQFGSAQKREKFSRDERHTFKVGDGRYILVDIPVPYKPLPKTVIHLLDHAAGEMLGK